MEAKDLTRPFVKLLSHIVDLLLAQWTQVYLLRTIRSEQAIRILICAALYQALSAGQGYTARGPE